MPIALATVDANVLLRLRETLRRVTSLQPVLAERGNGDTMACRPTCGEAAVGYIDFGRKPPAVPP